MPAASSTHAAFSRSMANIDFNQAPGSRRRRKSVSEVRADFSKSLDFTTDPNDLLPPSTQFESPTSVAANGTNSTKPPRRMKSRSSNDDNSAMKEEPFPVAPVHLQQRLTSKKQSGKSIHDVDDFAFFGDVEPPKKKHDRFSQSFSAFDFDPSDRVDPSENGLPSFATNNGRRGKKQPTASLRNLPKSGNHSFAVGDFGAFDGRSVKSAVQPRQQKRLDRFAQSFSSFDFNPHDLVSTSGSSTSGASNEMKAVRPKRRGSTEPRGTPPTLDEFTAAATASMSNSKRRASVSDRSVATTTTMVEKQKVSLEEFHNQNLFPRSSKRSGSKSVASCKSAGSRSMGSKSVGSASRSVSSGTSGEGKGHRTRRTPSRTSSGKSAHRNRSKSPETMERSRSQSRHSKHQNRSKSRETVEPSRSKSRERSLRRDRRTHSIERRERRTHSIERRDRRSGSVERSQPSNRTVHTEGSGDRRVPPTNAKPTRSKSSGDSHIHCDGQSVTSSMSRSHRGPPRRTLSGDMRPSPGAQDLHARRASVAGASVVNPALPSLSRRASVAGAGVADGHRAGETLGAAGSTRRLPRRTVSSDGSTRHRRVAASERKAVAPSDSKTLHASLSVLSYDHHTAKDKNESTTDPGKSTSVLNYDRSSSENTKEPPAPVSAASPSQRRTPSRTYSRGSSGAASTKSGTRHRKPRETPHRSNTYNGNSTRRLLNDSSATRRGGKKPPRRMSEAGASVVSCSTDKPSRRKSTAEATHRRAADKPYRRASTAGASVHSSIDRPSRRASHAGASVSSGIGNASMNMSKRQMDSSRKINKRQVAHGLLKDDQSGLKKEKARRSSKTHSNDGSSNSGSGSGSGGGSGNGERKKRSNRRRSVA